MSTLDWINRLSTNVTLGHHVWDKRETGKKGEATMNALCPCRQSLLKGDQSIQKSLTKAI